MKFIESKFYDRTVIIIFLIFNFKLISLDLRNMFYINYLDYRNNLII
jgi:hypothetical protein